MRGSIVKRSSGNYAVVIELPRTADGKRRQKWHNVGPSKKEAERKLAELLGQVHGGAYVNPSRATVKTFLEKKWLPAMAATVKPSTHELYSTLVRAYIVPRIGGTRLQDLTASDVNVLYADLLASGSKDGHPLSAKAVRNVHGVLHRALRDAVRWEVVTRNVAEAADPPRVAAPTVQAWTAENVATFLDHTAEDRLGPLWLLLAETGMRRGEALALRWSDVDLAASQAIVQRTAVLVAKKVTFSEPKTRGSRRLVPLPMGTVSALRDHRKRQAEERLAAGSVYADHGLVFCDEIGEPYRPGNVTRMFGLAVKAAKLPPLTLHGLRHTFCTLALGARVPVKVVAEVVGHSSTAITQDLYSHVTPGMAHDATAQVADLIARGR
jgi:integrase